ncbi:MAG: trypsin-like peptidase domain-containing protein, partial [Planctomycetota bacterium]
AYQSGFLVSPIGHIATVWSYVLDVDPVVILDDGRRFESKVIGFEPTLNLAVLKIQADDLPYFDFAKGEQAVGSSDAAASEEKDSSQLVPFGTPVLAISNLFGIATGNESASVMQGTVASTTPLNARRGTYKTTFEGDVYVLDLVANNPGAAGGAVTDYRGQLIGMLGKELRDAQTGVWLNYALPATQLRTAVGDIIEGRKVVRTAGDAKTLDAKDAHSFQSLGLVMVPDVLEKTPAYVDFVVPESPAARSGMKPDDLVLLVGQTRIDSQSALRTVLQTIVLKDNVSMTIQREEKIVPVTIRGLR